MVFKSFGERVLSHKLNWDQNTTQQAQKSTDIRSRYVAQYGNNTWTL